MGRALADLKQEMLSAAQEGGGGGLGHTKPEEDAEERKRRDKETIQVKTRPKTGDNPIKEISSLKKRLIKSEITCLHVVLTKVKLLYCYDPN